mgnify:CR=1 FL=1
MHFTAIYICENERIQSFIWENINVGNAGFKAVTKGMYVDITGLISYINRTLGTAEKLTCVSRPQRFGKSLAAKMLCKISESLQ